MASDKFKPMRRSTSSPANLIYHPYVIFYRVQGGDVPEIVRVVDERKDIEAALGADLALPLPYWLCLRSAQRGLFQSAAGRMPDRCSPPALPNHFK